MVPTALSKDFWGSCWFSLVSFAFFHITCAEYSGISVGLKRSDHAPSFMLASNLAPQNFFFLEGGGTLLTLFFFRGKVENICGWYHSHPGYGCWLSGIDVQTQMTLPGPCFVGVLLGFFTQT